MYTRKFYEMDKLDNRTYFIPHVHIITTLYDACIASVYIYYFIKKVGEKMQLKLTALSTFSCHG